MPNEYDYRFLVGWNGGDAIANAIVTLGSNGLKVDITDDVVKATCRIGRSEPDPLAGISSGGTFRATVKNYEQVYNAYGWSTRHGTK